VKAHLDGDAGALSYRLEQINQDAFFESLGFNHSGRGKMENKLHFRGDEFVLSDK